MAGQDDYPDLLGDDYLEDETTDPELTISDPFEPMNRLFFEFNDKLYEWVFKPVTDAYSWVVPKELRESFGNAFYNLSSPIRFFNTLLQADFETSGVVLKRFLINSSLGVYGLVDIASVEFGLEPVKADFGQTLGKWGMGEGVYFCWPVIGPSSVRDSLGWAVDLYSHPVTYFSDSLYQGFAYYVSDKVNKISLNPDRYEDLKRFSFDPYIATRQAYYEIRRGIIIDTKVKDED